MLFGKKKKARAEAEGAVAEGAAAEGAAAENTATETAATNDAAADEGAAAERPETQGAVEEAAPEGQAAPGGRAAAGGTTAPHTKAGEKGTAATRAADTATAETVAAVAAASADTDSGTPRDVAELSSTKGFLDFGGLLIPASPQQKVRLDMDQKTKRVVALTITLGQASIQLQPFSAPKSGGTWEEVREQIADSVKAQKGRIKEVDGRFGKELAARVPTTLKDGRQGWRVARFIGFEGPRWFLRGVVGGRGAIDSEAAREVEDFFASVVVVRGEDPLPPRELLPLRPPEGAKRVAVPRNPAQRRDAGNGPSPGAAALDSTSEGQS